MICFHDEDLGTEVIVRRRQRSTNKGTLHHLCDIQKQETQKHWPLPPSLYLNYRIVSLIHTNRHDDRRKQEQLSRRERAELCASSQKTNNTRHRPSWIQIVWETKNHRSSVQPKQGHNSQRIIGHRLSKESSRCYILELESKRIAVMCRSRLKRGRALFILLPSSQLTVECDLMPIA